MRSRFRRSRPSSLRLNRGGSKRQKQRLKEKRKSMNAEAREEERLELLARQVTSEAYSATI